MGAYSWYVPYTQNEFWVFMLSKVGFRNIEYCMYSFSMILVEMICKTIGIDMLLKLWEMIALILDNKWNFCYELLHQNIVMNNWHNNGLWEGMIYSQ